MEKPLPPGVVYFFPKLWVKTCIVLFCVCLYGLAWSFPVLGLRNNGVFLFCFFTILVLVCDGWMNGVRKK